MYDYHTEESEEEHRDRWRDEAANYAAFLIVKKGKSRDKAIQNAKDCIEHLKEIPNIEGNDWEAEEIYEEYGLGNYNDNKLTNRMYAIAKEIRGEFDDFLASWE